MRLTNSWRCRDRPLDPSTRRRDRNLDLFGTGKCNRVLIDATINLDYDPDPELGDARFTPTVWLDEADIDKACARWSELGRKAADPPESSRWVEFFARRGASTAGALAASCRPATTWVSMTITLSYCRRDFGLSVLRRSN